MPIFVYRAPDLRLRTSHFPIHFFGRILVQFWILSTAGMWASARLEVGAGENALSVADFVGVVNSTSPQAARRL